MIEAALSGTLAALISGVSAYFSMKAARNSQPVETGFIHVKTELQYLRERIDRHIDQHVT